jgi:hypothetical protein
MAVTIQLRRGSAATWTSANPVLAEGEIGVETDTDLFKIGDGSTAWNSLSYGGLSGTNGTNGEGVPVGGTAGQILVKDSSTDYDTSWSSAHAPYESDQAIIAAQIFG